MILQNLVKKILTLMILKMMIFMIYMNGPMNYLLKIHLKILLQIWKYKIHLKILFQIWKYKIHLKILFQIRKYKIHLKILLQIGKYKFFKFENIK